MFDPNYREIVKDKRIQTYHNKSIFSFVKLWLNKTVFIYLTTSFRSIALELNLARVTPKRISDMALRKKEKKDRNPRHGRTID